MVDKNMVLHYLQELEEAIDRIERMDFTFDMILGNEDIQDLLDRRMQKAIEACIDIAAHITASQKLGQAKSAGDLFTLLNKAKIIDSELANKLNQAVSFRNILVHEYSEVDYKLAYTNLKDKLKDLKQFASKINLLLK